jgi:hypothetical protein
MTALRYRRRHTRYAVGAAGRQGTVVEWWQVTRMVVVAPAAWRPRADVFEKPAELRKEITFRFADDADQVLDEALGVATPAGVD